MKRTIVIILIAAGLIGVILYYVPMSLGPLNRLVMYPIEKRLDARIKYDSLTMMPLRHLGVEGIKASGRGGSLVTIGKGDFSYSFISLIATGRLTIHCKLKDVAVYGRASLLDLIVDLLNIDLLKGIEFTDVEGTFYVGKEDTITQKLKGTGEDFKFDLDGITGKDNSINLRVKLLLNDTLTELIPEEMQKGLLEKEEGGWSSVTMGMTGNYKKPSLRVINKLFRINISPKM